MSDEESASLSVKQTVGCLFVAASFFAWGVLAASYVGGTSPGSMGAGTGTGFGDKYAGVIMFIIVAVVEIPELFTVISWHAAHRLWLLIAMAAMPVGVIALGFGMQRLERQLEGPPKRRRKK